MNVKVIAITIELYFSSKCHLINLLGHRKRREITYKHTVVLSQISFMHKRWLQLKQNTIRFIILRQIEKA